MSLDQIVSELKLLSDDERSQLLLQMEQLIKQHTEHRNGKFTDPVQAVRDSWASLPVDAKMAQWIAEDDELIYEAG